MGLVIRYVPNDFGNGQAPPFAQPVLHPTEHPQPPLPSFGHLHPGPQLQFCSTVHPGPQPQLVSPALAWHPQSQPPVHLPSFISQGLPDRQPHEQLPAHLPSFMLQYVPVDALVSAVWQPQGHPGPQSPPVGHPQSTPAPLRSDTFAKFRWIQTEWGGKLPLSFSMLCATK